MLGHSGCGKTTLLTMMAGFEQPSIGSILVDGKPVGKPTWQRSVVFQDYALFPWMTVHENVSFGLEMKGIAAVDREEIIRRHIELVGLTGFEKRYPHQLSGGMKQRVSIARALAVDPKVLLMDEPFAALDALTREQLYGDIQKIWQARRKTILFVTHNVREAACLGDRVILFSPNPGRIRKDFTVTLPRPRDINSVELAHYSTEITAALKGFTPGEGREASE